MVLKRIFFAFSLALFLHMLAGLFLGQGIGNLQEGFFTPFGFLLTAGVAFTEMTFLAQ